MVDFYYYLNRQGAKGAQGEKGEAGKDGTTPTVSVGTNTSTEYTLIFDSGDGNTFETDNLRAPVVDMGGTYLRFNRDTSTQYIGNPDTATTSVYGVVKLANTDGTGDLTDCVPLELLDSTKLELTNSINLLSDIKADKITTYTKTEVDNALATKADISDIPTVGNGTITFTQGGVVKGTITTNQSGNSTIALDAGGGGSAINILPGDAIKVGTAGNNKTISVLYDNSTIKLDSNGKLKADFTGLATTSDLNGKANVVHTHTVSDITNFPTIGNGTVSIYQNGSLAGTFTMNQTGDTTINLTGGGGGTTYSAGTGIDITGNVISVDSSVVAMQTDLADMATKTWVGNQGYLISVSWNDINGKPSTFTPSAHTHTVSEITDFPTLATVATSGSYNDLTNKPSIPTQPSDIGAQEVLVSGTNLKTINGNSLLGSGNIVISSGGQITVDQIYDATSANAQSGVAIAGAGFLTSTDISDMATKTWVGNQGYTTNVGTVTSVNNVSPVNGNVTISIPTDTNDLTNGAGFITGINSSDVTTALGYTPYNSNNPNGYTSNVGTVTSVNSNLPDANGNVSLSIPVVNDSTVSFTVNGVSVGSITMNQSAGSTIALTDTQYSVMTGATSGAAGTAGLVPQPLSTDTNKYLRGDGTWATVSSGTSFTTTAPLVLSSGVLSLSINSNTLFVNSNNELEVDNTPINNALVAILGGNVSVFDDYATDLSYSNNVLQLVNQDGNTIGTGVTITAGSSITVDQVYDSSSANPQSGVAIAGAGFLTSISSANVTSALGYTPYSSLNPSGYQANVLEGIQVGGNNITITNKIANIALDSSTMNFTNGVLGANLQSIDQALIALNGGTASVFNNYYTKSETYSKAETNALIPTTMTGAGSSAAGTSGLVPQPALGDDNKFLRGDATWQTIHNPSAYLVEVSSSSIMPSWYRVYSDGWCEQGGVASVGTSTSGTQVNLTKTFTNTDYNVECTIKFPSGISNFWSNTICTGSQAVGSFNIYTGSVQSQQPVAQTVCWRAAGFTTLS